MKGNTCLAIKYRTIINPNNQAPYFIAEEATSFSFVWSFLDSIYITPFLNSIARVFYNNLPENQEIL